MSEQESSLLSVSERPTADDHSAWRKYWKVQGQPWRTEPEIDPKRQEYLTKRLRIVPNIEQGVYPFKGEKLNRADVEWLLTAHNNERGSLVRRDESPWDRQGLDLRGANLSKADLRSLPLSGLIGGLMRENEEWSEANMEEQVIRDQREMAAVQLQGASLQYAQLQGAILVGAQMQGVNLSGVELQGAALICAQLEGAFLNYAELQGACLFRADLSDANLSHADLRETVLWEAQLKNADLRRAQLRGANLYNANLHGANLTEVTLADKNGIGPQLVDVQWGTVNLAVVDWSQMAVTGEEYMAREKKHRRRGTKDPSIKLYEYKRSVRANRQLAVVLREQGLNEEADHFAYRAQKLQCIVLRIQRKFGKYLFLRFLDLLAGYGYRPERSVFWYFVITFGFAAAYHVFGGLALIPPDALVFSLTSFHGRGFFPGLQNQHTLHDPLVMLAALEAVVGLFIEISFIATFTKRFFGS